MGGPVILKRSFFIVILMFNSIGYGQEGMSPDHLHSVFAHQKEAIASFIDHVLRQLPSTLLLNLVDQIKKEHSTPLNDAQLYTQISAKLAPYRSCFDTIKIIKLIRFQKQTLKKQIEALLGKTTVIQNYLEIGTPGTYASTIAGLIKGKTYALLDAPRMTDRLQAYSLSLSKGFKGYDEYVALNDYEPISAQIPQGSIDLIICTIGLHHCPPSKLNAFISSIKRVLRPGGIFLLREHNAHTPELVSLASAAHSIFNAVIAKESTQANKEEVRNFNALEYWKNLLEEHGFAIELNEALQEGDSTLNTFIRCNKKCITVQEQESNASWQAQQHTDYARDGVQTYLTTPEWNNVDAAQHYGEYINSIPFYEFPYMAHVRTFWKTFGSSWRCAAKQKGGNVKLLTSPSIFFNYTLMNVFIGTFMTVEYSAKALVSWPIRLMLSGAEATTLLALVHDPCDEISHIDPSITLKESYEGALKLVSIPRYLQFLASMKRLKDSSVNFIKIAHNDHILCKIRYCNTNIPVFKSSWEQKFTWRMPTLPGYTYATYLIPVNEIKEFIKTVEVHKNSELLYIHDF